MSGYPDRLFRLIGHPVSWMGRLIGWLDCALNRETWTSPARRIAGVVALGLLIAFTGAVALLVSHAVNLIGLLLWLHWPHLPGMGIALLALASSLLFGTRSLNTHVLAVADGLDAEGLDGGRRAVAQIVGRDPDVLDESGVCRAAIESLAENFSDGVVAPVLWFLIGGLPGLVIYKAVNTADSMVGHKTPRHLAFGWASARLDDVLNLPASRLTALLTLICASTLPGASAAQAAEAIKRDARKHKSPNAGWPEAAFAGALGLKLAGPRQYHGEIVNDAYMGSGRYTMTSADVRRALQLYRRICAAGLLLLVAIEVGPIFLGS
jgi:adenosylcobinamide-phosphate synthase